MNPEAWEVILFRVRSSWGLGVTKPPLNLKVLADHTKLGRVRSSHRRPRPPFPFSFCSVPPLLTQFLGSGRCPEGETGQAKTALGTPDGNRGRCGPDSPPSPAPSGSSVVRGTDGISLDAQKPLAQPTSSCEESDSVFGCLSGPDKRRASSWVGRRAGKQHGSMCRKTLGLK